VQQNQNNNTTKTNKNAQNANICITFVLTVLTTLPVRSASQGESFAFIGFTDFFKYTSQADFQSHLWGAFLCPYTNA